jgi:photosystem II stability/assembly factor-like uncharacterized protein
MASRLIARILFVALALICSIPAQGGDQPRAAQPARAHQANTVPDSGALPGRTVQEPVPAPIPPAPNPMSASERMASWRRHVEMRDASVFRNLEWRAVGPRMQGGRIEAIAVDPSDTATIYVGAGAGNLWKTENNGITWRPIFERQSTFTIGDVTVAPADPNVVWVGTGEVLMARSSFAGTGVFKSEDGGESWRHMGLTDSHHIAKVVIHPTDPSVVWVAAIGHLYSFNDERGIFKTIDGGRTWERVLFVNERTGAIDLAIDPADPDILYAAMWERSRRAWGHTQSGSGSGIYKSEDGGASWRPVTEGFPTGEYVGRIDLTVAPSQPRTLYALLDNRAPQEPDEEGRRQPSGEVYRSDDRGESWRKVGERNIPAGYDFCIIEVAPDDPDRVYVPGQVFWVSDDGGRTFAELGGTIVHLLDHEAAVLHLDQHELWIDPDDPEHMLVGNDGGVYQTYDRGANWLHLNNLPIAEFYAINVDMAMPYNIYGGTQDDAALFGPSNVEIADGREDPWQHVYIDRWGGGDSYFTPVHPIDSHVVFYEHQFGALRRKDLRDGTTASIQPRAAEGETPLRYNWMTPFVISHYDPDTIYYGTQMVMVSSDRGDTWQAISPDLTTDPGPERQGNVPFGTLTSISESGLQSGVIWTGSDDGRVHVTRDGGDTWIDVSASLPDLWISRVLASRHDEERAYVSLTGYREDDFSAYLFATSDLGASWRPIAGGLPEESINVVGEDPARPGVLYVGTDLGVYVSLDDGATWQSLVNTLPTTPVHDLIVHSRDNELVIGTHGRSAFVLDVSPIQQYTPEVAASPGHLFEIAPAVLSFPDGRPGAYRHGTTAGEAVFTFHLQQPSPLSVIIKNAGGEMVRVLESAGEEGLNVVHWNLRAEEDDGPRGSFSPYPLHVEPGTYRIQIETGELVLEGSLIVLGP